MNLLKTDGNTVIFRELSRVIKDQINTGKYSVGDRLPSEIELQELYSVSRITVRNAIELLAHDGLVEKQRGRGKGTIVLAESKTKKLRKGLTFGTFFSIENLTNNNSILEVMEGIIRTLNIWEANLSILPFVPEVDQVDYVRSVVDRKLVDGMFLWPMSNHTEPVINFLDKLDYPFIFLEPSLTEYTHEMTLPNTIKDIPRIYIDEMPGIDKLLERIKKRGLNQISILGFEGIEFKRTSQIFTQSRHSASFKIDTLEISTTNPLEEIIKILKKSTGNRKKLLLISNSDLLSYFDAAISWLKIKMPEDVSVVRYQHNCHSKSDLFQRYTTLDRPFLKLGELAAKMMGELITEKMTGQNLLDEKQKIIDSLLIDRGSALI